jgi:phage terminase small subunit
MTDDIDETPKPKAKRTAPAKGSRPSRAKRHLAVVAGTDTEAETPKAKPTKGESFGAVKGATNILTGLTDKQEAFALAVVDGKNASDAYRLAYDAEKMAAPSVWTEACLLLAHPKVAHRITELSLEKEHQRRMLAVSRAERVLDRLEKLAENSKADSVRVRANELLGKTAGLFADQIEIEDKTDRSTADIEQSIAMKLARLGLTR